jgi:hypothetical protein
MKTSNNNKSMRGSGKQWPYWYTPYYILHGGFLIMNDSGGISHLELFHILFVHRRSHVVIFNHTTSNIKSFQTRYYSYYASSLGISGGKPISTAALSTPPFSRTRSAPVNPRVE